MFSQNSRYDRNRIIPWGFVSAAVISAFGLVSSSHAGTVTFGSGANSFSMEFVTIGNPGNPADSTGAPNPAGAVDYEYGIGKFEVSELMIDMYNANFGTANNLVITKDTRAANKPATKVSWNEAARFVNWLNTSTGGFAAYKFTTSGVVDNIALWTDADVDDYDATNPYRSKRATYVLPNYNEWYKAAYFNPNDSTYYDYTTGSNTAPSAVASGTAANTAVFGGGAVTGPADVDQAGGLSAYGVMGLGGNVREYEETSYDFLNNSPTSFRALRGGTWTDTVSSLSSSTRNSNFDPTFSNAQSGFRVAMVTPAFAPAAVPEPSMMVIGTLFGLGGLMSKRRTKK